jgi:hypothetical protein
MSVKLTQFISKYLITEAIAADKWKQEIQTAFNKSTGITLNFDSDTVLKNSLFLAIASPSGNLSPTQINPKFLPVMDLFANLRFNNTDFTEKSKTYTKIDDFFAKITEFLQTANSATNKIIEDWIKSCTSYGDYEPSSTIRIKECHRKALESKDVLEKIAFSQYQQFFVQPAIQEIVKRRITVAQRVGALKSINKPFGTLIKDIFDKLPNYVSGAPGAFQSRISSDFGEIVNELHVDSILKVAAYSYIYWRVRSQLFYQPTTAAPGDGKAPRVRDYKAEYQRKKQLKAERAGAVATPTVPTNASLEILANNILNELLGAPEAIASAGAGLAAAVITAIRSHYVEEHKEYMEFALNGRMYGMEAVKNEKGEVVIGPGGDVKLKPNGQIDKEIYTIKRIQESMSATDQQERTAATKLIKELSSIAEYVRIKPGAKERLGQADQAIQGVKGLMGHSLYVGS